MLLLLTLFSKEADLESLLDALRIFLRSFDFTFNELPVDNFVIVTEPMEEPLLETLGEVGSLDSKPFEEQLEVTVDDTEDFSDPEQEDGRDLSLDAFEWGLTEPEVVFVTELCTPVDTKSLLLTGDMVTPSLLLHLVGVPTEDPKSFPIASSTLSLPKSLLESIECLLVASSLVSLIFLYT